MFITLTGLMCLPTMAQSQTVVMSGLELKTMVPTLVASPGMCELPSGQSICQMKTTLIWEVPKAGHFCLKDTEMEQALECWNNNWSGTHQVEFSAGNNKTYILTRGPKGTIAANITVKVIGSLEQRMRAKRRRGFWRIF